MMNRAPPAEESGRDRSFDAEMSVNPALVASAAYANSFKALDPWFGATGFRTTELSYCSPLPFRETQVAEEFLVNTRLTRHDRESEASIAAYFTESAAVMLSLAGREEEGEHDSVELSDGDVLRMELGEALARRRSHRTYTGDTIDLDCLAAVLRGAAGVSARAHTETADGSPLTFELRTAPSAGGLYPIELHVAALRIRGLERGIYRYDSSGHHLVRTGAQQDLERLLGACAMPDEQISVSRANAVFLLIGQPWKSMRKYGPRGLRLLFLEAGAISQNVHLATAALGLGSVDCASVYDDEAHEVLGLDGLHEVLLHVLILGSIG
jgi:SagB-type dehydrogenase family enzyme